MKQRLCKDCEYMKSRLSGIVSTSCWCGLVGNGYNGTSIGVFPWLNKPHPKCPLKEAKQ